MCVHVFPSNVCEGRCSTNKHTQTRQDNHIDRVRPSSFHVRTSGALCALNMFDGSDYLTMSQFALSFNMEKNTHMTSLHSLRGMLKLNVRCSCSTGSSLPLKRLLSSATAVSPSLFRSPRFRVAPCSCTRELRLRLRGRVGWDVRRPCVHASLIAATCSNLYASMDAKHKISTRSNKTMKLSM